jgi:hypothetical protein
MRSSIKTEGQLCSMVKTRSGISEQQAKRDVDAWMQGKQFCSIVGSKNRRERHMTPADRAAERKETSPAINPEATEEMAKYGITRVPIDYFHYKGYRYTSLDDAIAQAKREHPADRSDRRERSGSS